MCIFGGGSKAPAPMAPPPPAPTPEGPSKQINVKDNLAKLRMGLASTIKTSPRGITGTGANLVAASSTGKQKLGV